MMRTNSPTPAVSKLSARLIGAPEKKKGAKDIANNVRARAAAGHPVILSCFPKAWAGEWKAENVNRYKPEGICGSATHITMCQFNSVWESKSKGVFEHPPPLRCSLIVTERGIYGCLASATNYPIIESHKNDWGMYTGLCFVGAQGKQGPRSELNKTPPHPRQASFLFSKPELYMCLVN